MLPRRQSSSIHCSTERPVRGCSNSKEGLLSARVQGEAWGFWDLHIFDISR